MVIAAGLVVALRLVIALCLVIALRLVIAGLAPSPCTSDSLASVGRVAASRLSLLIALIVRPGSFGLLTGIPATRGAVPSTHVCSIPRRCGGRLLASVHDPGAAGTAPEVTQHLEATSGIAMIMANTPNVDIGPGGIGWYETAG